jgi:CheY-specific phosphatase CheX
MNHASHKPDLARIGQRALTEVLATFEPLPATPRDSSAPTLVHAPDQLAAEVALAGRQLAGTVRVLLPLAFVAWAVKQLTGLDGAEQEAVQEDATGEIANMVAGRVAAQLAAGGYSCTLGTPAVSRNASFPVKTQAGVDLGRTDLLHNGHWLYLEIECRYTAQ